MTNTHVAEGAIAVTAVDGYCAVMMHDDLPRESLNE